MKKIAISLVALAAVSTVAFAGENRSYELRDSDTYFGKYSTQLEAKNYNGNSAAFAVVNDSAPVTAFERMKRISEENTSNRH